MHQANILDPIQDQLDQRVFEGTNLKPRILNFIKRLYYRAFEQEFGISAEEATKYVQLVLTGSLTTYQYSDTSDCDVSVFCDFDEFWKLGLDEDTVRKAMIAMNIEHLDGTFLPGGSHPMQFFAVAPGILPADQFRKGVRSGYDIETEQWIVPPERERSHDVSLEFPDVYERASQMNEKMTQMLDAGDKRHAIMLWNQIHKKRQLDQRAGLGDFSEGNIVYKWLVNSGVVDRIRNELGLQIETAWKPDSNNPMEIWHYVYDTVMEDGDEPDEAVSIADRVIRLMNQGYDWEWMLSELRGRISKTAVDWGGDLDPRLLDEERDVGGMRTWVKLQQQIVELARDMGVAIEWYGRDKLMDSQHQVSYDAREGWDDVKWRSTVRFPTITGEHSYFTALHELGHAAFRQQYGYTMDHKNSQEEESWAWHFALENAQIPFDQETLEWAQKMFQSYRDDQYQSPKYPYWYNSGRPPLPRSSAWSIVEPTGDAWFRMPEKALQIALQTMECPVCHHHLLQENTAVWCPQCGWEPNPTEHTSTHVPRVLYHVADPRTRESIELHGLHPQFDQTGYGAVYLSAKPLSTHLDTWRVYTQGLDIEPDITTPGFEGEWWMTKDVVHPDRLELLEVEDHEYLFNAATLNRVDINNKDINTTDKDEEEPLQIIYDWENDRIIIGVESTELPDHKIVGEYHKGEVTLFEADKQWINPSYFRRLWNASYPERPLNKVHLKRGEIKHELRLKDKMIDKHQPLLKLE